MTREQSQPARKWILPAIIIGLISLGMTIYYFNWKEFPTSPSAADIPVVMGHREGCFLCHKDMTGFSASHDPAAIGCSSCHLGDPLTADKENAHQGIIMVPGNMVTVMKSCGQAACHHDLALKVTGSLMATGQGMVSVNRYVFAQTQSPDGPGHLSHLGESAADTHLRQLCVTCHLGFPKKQSAPIDQESRGGGCTACHIDYTDAAASQMETYHQSGDLPHQHPALNIKINNDRCFGCHSRSARISLNYEGWHETMLKTVSQASQERYRTLQDKRILVHKGADIHHEKGMLCIDCHTARDAMGDGTSYNHQGEQVETTCKDCHTHQIGKYTEAARLDADSIKILQLRQEAGRKTDQYLNARRTGRPIINLTRGADGSPRFKGKLDGRERELKPPATACTDINGHERLTCQACHTQWAPSCIECHTQYLPEKKRADHYTGEKVAGVWREYKGDLRSSPPALGVRRDKRLKEDVVDTFIPGMILTIGGINKDLPDPQAPSDKDQDRYQVFRRMFSPTFSHTIQKAGRTCESCHQEPWAVGLGEGRIVYGATRNKDEPIPMTFIPKSGRHPADGLPRDAWTAFMKSRTRHTSTRTGSRPFNLDEQQRILGVGQCLLCHQSNDADMSQIYRHFPEAMARRPAPCFRKPPQP